MGLYYDLPVYNEVFNLILLIYKFEKRFRREYKYKWQSKQ